MKKPFFNPTGLFHCPVGVDSTNLLLLWILDQWAEDHRLFFDLNTDLYISKYLRDDELHSASVNVALDLGMEFVEKSIENDKPTLFYSIENKLINNEI